MPKRQRRPRLTTQVQDSRLKGDVCLLGLDRCRALLPADCALSDAELERLRDGLYALAGVAVEGFLTHPGFAERKDLEDKEETADLSRQRCAILRG